MTRVLSGPSCFCAPATVCVASPGIALS
jgi:hypothetical protein